MNRRNQRSLRIAQPTAVVAQPTAVVAQTTAVVAQATAVVAQRAISAVGLVVRYQPFPNLPQSPLVRKPDGASTIAIIGETQSSQRSPKSLAGGDNHRILKPPDPCALAGRKNRESQTRLPVGSGSCGPLRAMELVYDWAHPALANSSSLQPEMGERSQRREGCRPLEFVLV
jgi:hypothetical protein